MKNQRRGRWVELDVDGVPTLVHPYWTEDTETLTLAIRETGWLATAGQAREAAEGARLHWRWIGTDEDLQLRDCHWDGWNDELGDYLSDVSQVTLAELPSLG